MCSCSLLSGKIPYRRKFVLRFAFIGAARKNSGFRETWRVLGCRCRTSDDSFGSSMFNISVCVFSFLIRTFLRKYYTFCEVCFLSRFNMLNIFRNTAIIRWEISHFGTGACFILHFMKSLLFLSRNIMNVSMSQTKTEIIITIRSDLNTEK